MNSIQVIFEFHCIYISTYLLKSEFKVEIVLCLKECSESDEEDSIDDTPLSGCIITFSRVKQYRLKFSCLRNKWRNIAASMGMVRSQHLKIAKHGSLDDEDNIVVKIVKAIHSVEPLLVLLLPWHSLLSFYPFQQHLRYTIALSQRFQGGEFGSFVYCGRTCNVMTTLISEVSLTLGY